MKVYLEPGFMKSTGLLLVVCAVVFVSACSTAQPTETLPPPTPQRISTPRQLPPDILTRTPVPPNWTVVPTTPTIDIAQATPVATEVEATSPWNGLIQIPWGVGDAGNWFLYATAQLTLTWNSPPPDCERYEFIVEASSDSRTVIGTDFEPSDGVSIDWEVPENISGSLYGEALCEGDQIRRSIWSGELYSGTAPPEGVCTLASGTIGAVDLYSTPSLSSATDAFLIPGIFAPVLERTNDGWYRIDDSATEDWPTGAAPTGPAWVWSEYSLKFFGPCESVPIAD
ncbi:MAG: hypothetical protein ACE5M4_01760 [Anaerolineales bacterium]